MNRAKQGIQPSDQSAFVSSGGYKISKKNLEIKTVPFRFYPSRVTAPYLQHKITGKLQNWRRHILSSYIAQMAAITIRQAQR
jgi:hypothetical protein